MNLDIVAKPLGSFLYLIYNGLKFLDPTTGFGWAYGLSIIIFTVIIKLVLLPLTVKQYKSTSKMQEIQPQIQELQRKYKNDKEKLNVELMNIYKENKVNPAGGCLPLLIQMPILFSLYWVFVQPLKLMLGKTLPQVTELVRIQTGLSGSALTSKAASIYKGFGQIDLINFFNTHQDKLANQASNLKTSELINMNFVGLHLNQVATYLPNKIASNPGLYIPLFLLVIVSVATTYVSTKMSMPKPNKDVKTNNNQAGNQMAGMQTSMMYIAPVMTLFIGFSVPSALVLYWTVGYVFTIFQQRYINKHVLKKKEVAI